MQITDETFELQGLLQLLESGTPLPANFPNLIVAKAESILAHARALASGGAVGGAISDESDQSDSSDKPAPAPQKLRLTLNDTIRFTRELFAGNRAALDEALTFAASLPDWSEVEEYLFTDLSFDPSHPATAEFTELLHHQYHLLHRR